MTRRARGLRPKSLLDAPSSAPRHFWVGIDGEGVTEGEPREYSASCAITGERHRYISMSWRRSDGRGDQLEDRKGLTTSDCLAFLCSIPEDAKIAAYGFGYDLAKILEDLPPELLFLLTHGERREYRVKGGRTGRRPVVYREWALDLFNTRFKVGKACAKTSPLGFEQHTIGEPRAVHDLAKFYQARFVTACKNWDVGTPDERDTMRRMKADRRNLARYTQDEILAYSNKECRWLAELAEKLDTACDETGAKLRGQYFGAGSIAKALMRSWGIKEKIAVLPREVERAALAAFFGGRFEVAIRGLITQPLHDRDISAAYPYQIYRLPCLQCGKWTKTRDVERARAARAALVHYELLPWKGALPPWGPFPFRDEDHTIPFPIESGGGWLHKDEFFAGARHFHNVRMREAWVYESDCEHWPFREIAAAYLERLRLGKEGAGIVVKLGTNAVAGSIMQTVGSRPYHCPVWAGMITSGTRADLLDMAASHEKWSDVVMMATDGLWALSKAEAPKPEDTGTDRDVIESATGKVNRKPLGGWEHDILPEGAFLARPGIYFPMGMGELAAEESERDDKVLKDLKARGIGIRTLYGHRKEILVHYERTGGREPYVIGDERPLDVIRERETPRGVERFVGLKSGIVRTVKTDERGAMIGESIRRRDVYGLWTLQKRIIDFKALPKRLEGNGRELEVRRLPFLQKSLPYAKMGRPLAFEDLLADAIELGRRDDEQDDWAE